MKLKMTLQGREACGPVLMMGLLQSALIACLPWLIKRTGLSAGDWSLILSAGMVPVLLGAPWWGRAVDRRGARAVIRLATLLVSTGFVVVLLVLGSGVQGVFAAAFLLVARLFHGAGAGAIFPAAQRLAVTGVDPDEWSYRLSRLQMAVHVGRLSGPGLVALAAWLGMMEVLVLIGALAVWLGFASNQTSRKEAPVKAACSEARLRLSWGPGRYLYLVALVLTCWVGALQFVLGPVLTRLAQVSPEVGSSLTAVALVFTSVIGLVLGPLIHSRIRSHLKLMLIWGGALVLAGVILSRADSVGEIYMGVAFLAFGAAVLTPWYGSQIRKCQPDSHGEVAGRLTSTHTLGYIVGTLAGGWLLDTYPEWVTVAFVLPAPLIVAIAVRARKEMKSDGAGPARVWRI